MKVSEIPKNHYFDYNNKVFIRGNYYIDNYHIKAVECRSCELVKFEPCIEVKYHGKKFSLVK
jgi:hypothetical protein